MNRSMRPTIVCADHLHQIAFRRPADSRRIDWFDAYYRRLRVRGIYG